MTTSTYRSWDAIITRVYGATGTPPGGDPAVIKYDAMAVNTGDGVRLTNHLPTRRISIGAKIVAAGVGDPCRIVSVNGGHFLHVVEGIRFREACPQGVR